MGKSSLGLEPWRKVSSSHSHYSLNLSETFAIKVTSNLMEKIWELQNNIKNRMGGKRKECEQNYYINY